MKPGYVYRAFDAAGELLYIGCTIKPSSRFTQHQSEKDWWPEVASITLECHESREAALSVERVAIAKERPFHNRRVDSSLLSLDEARGSLGVASVTVRPLSSVNADRNRLALKGMSEAERICGKRAEVLAGEQARLKAEFLARAERTAA